MVLEDFRLKIFVAVAETGSFTKAAAALGITQPAVSQNIAELEKCLNVRLFTRSRGEAVLTDGGRTFAKYAERILEWYAAADAMFGPEGRETGNRRWLCGVFRASGLDQGHIIRVRGGFHGQDIRFRLRSRVPPGGAGRGAGCSRHVRLHNVPPPFSGI